MGGSPANPTLLIKQKVYLTGYGMQDYHQIPFYWLLLTIVWYRSLCNRLAFVNRKKSVPYHVIISYKPLQEALVDK